VSTVYYLRLHKRKSDLSLLNCDHLESEEKLVEQMQLLNKMEKALESEHSSFVQLSQFCSELVERFQHDRFNTGEVPVAEKLRSQLDDVTQTWDSIIGRLEEHSRAVCGWIE